MHLPRIVIVGGGFGGVGTALHLARRRIRADIVLVDRGDALAYTPWLYEVASGRSDGMSRDDRRRLRSSAGIRFSEIFGPYPQVRLRKAVVTGVDVGRRHVLCADGMTIAFDALVLCVGAETAFFGIPGVAEHALRLKTVDDAVSIAEQMATLLDAVHGARRQAHVLVAGAGASGVELVAELASMVRARERRGLLPRCAVRLTLVDAGSRVLGMSSPKLSRCVERRLRALGVDVVLDTMVARADAHTVVVQPRPKTPADIGALRSPYTTATEVPHDLFVWCGGVAPSTVTAACAVPKDARGRFLVDPTFEVQGQVGIFALGDVAAWSDVHGALPQTAQAADEAARTVADNVVRALARHALRPFVPPRRWPFALAVGGRYGVAEYRGLLLTDGAAYLLRRLADLRYCMRVLPWRRALHVWRSRMKLYAEND